jgi:type IV pilus assembly protein PilM
MFKPETVLGLDIGTSSIKIVELRKSKSNSNSETIELANLATAELPVGERGGAIDKDEVIVETIKKMVQQNNIKTRQAAISLPGSAAFIKHIKVPPVTDYKIDRIIFYEAQQQIPLPLDEVIFSYQVLNKKTPQELTAMLVAVKKELVNRYISLVNKAGLKVTAVDLSPIAFFNNVRFTQGGVKKEVNLLIHIGASATDIGIQQDGELRFVRSLPLAGHHLTKTIQREMHISFQEAERLKREEGKIITKVLEKLIIEIQRSLTLYQSQSEGKVSIFNKVILGGGESRLPNLARFLGERLGIEVEPLLPLSKIHIAPPHQDRLDPSLSVAMGLALRGINQIAIDIDLLPLELKRRREFKGKRGYLISSALIALLIPLTFFPPILRNCRVMEGRLKVITTKLREYKQFGLKLPQIKKLKGDNSIIETRIKILKGMVEESNLHLEILSQLGKTIPDEIWLNNFSAEEGGSSTISGDAPSYQTIEDFISRLEESPLFKEVKLLSATAASVKSSRSSPGRRGRRRSPDPEPEKGNEEEKESINFTISLTLTRLYRKNPLGDKAQTDKGINQSTPARQRLAGGKAQSSKDTKGKTNPATLEETLRLPDRLKRALSSRE